MTEYKADNAAHCPEAFVIRIQFRKQTRNHRIDVQMNKLASFCVGISSAVALLAHSRPAGVPTTRFHFSTASLFDLSLLLRLQKRRKKY